MGGEVGGRAGLRSPAASPRAPGGWVGAEECVESGVSVDALGEEHPCERRERQSEARGHQTRATHPRTLGHGASFRARRGDAEGEGQAVGERGGAGKAGWQTPRRGSCPPSIEPGRAPRVHQAGHGERRGLDLDEEVGERIGPKGELARQAFEGDHRERPEVCPVVDLDACDLLGAHVRGRTDALGGPRRSRDLRAGTER